MGQIYKITNTINNKIYVGQTTRTIEIRWREHKKNIEALKHRLPLYKALDKYGVDNFTIELLEDCENDKLNEREVYWIKKLESFGDKGYNCTVGGQGNTIREDPSQHIDAIIEGYLQGERLDVMCSKYNHAYETIRPLIEQRGIKIDTHAGPKKLSKEIYQIHPLDKTVIKVYPSISAAARDICEEGKNYKAIANHISRYKNTDTVSHGYLWETRKEIVDND